MLPRNALQSKSFPFITLLTHQSNKPVLATPDFFSDIIVFRDVLVQTFLCYFLRVLSFKKLSFA